LKIISFGKINREMVKTQTVRRPTWRPKNCRPTVLSGPRIPITCAFLLLLLLLKISLSGLEGSVVISKGKEKMRKEKEPLYVSPRGGRPPATYHRDARATPAAAAVRVLGGGQHTYVRVNSNWFIIHSNVIQVELVRRIIHIAFALFQLYNPECRQSM
jgi:hypothetical protein